jgi:hypothetical protein
MTYPPALRKLWRWLTPNDAPVVINYSGGNASAYSIRLIIHGVLPRPRHLLVVFADTGSEKISTYRHVAAMERLCAEHAIEFRRCSSWQRRKRDPLVWRDAWGIGDGVTRIGDDTARARIGRPPMPLDPATSKLHEVLLALPQMPEGSRIDQPPIYIDQPGTRGQMPARCTRHWKIRPMARVVKAWLRSLQARIGDGWRIGVGERHRVVEIDRFRRYLGGPLCVRWIGYTHDERARALKTAKYQQEFEGWLRYPAIALRKHRGQVDADTVDWGYKLAPWSACVCCPRDDVERVQATDGDDLALKIACDKAIRDVSAIGITRGLAYLSDECLPIEDVRARGRTQLQLFPGTPCGGGYCIS